MMRGAAADGVTGAGGAGGFTTGGGASGGWFGGTYTTGQPVLVAAAWVGQASAVSSRPSPSRSSHASPTPLRSASSWPGFLAFGQLSIASRTPSASVSTGQPSGPP